MTNNCGHCPLFLCTQEIQNYKRMHRKQTDVVGKTGRKREREKKEERATDTEKRKKRMANCPKVLCETSEEIRGDQVKEK